MTRPASPSGVRAATLPLNLPALPPVAPMPAAPRPVPFPRVMRLCP